MKRLSLPAGAIGDARRLRLGATGAERRLWLSLREGLPEARFRRQVPIGPYFADFCSHRAKLIVEIDGPQHAGAEAYDAARTRFLEREGYRVLRFWNYQVVEDLDLVLAAIVEALPELPPRKRLREAQAEFVSTAPITSLPPCGGEAGEGGADAKRRRAASLRTPTPTPPHKGEGRARVDALRARGFAPHPLPSPPHKGEGVNDNLRLESI